jgi:hypothetical protein
MSGHTVDRPRRERQFLCNWKVEGEIMNKEPPSSNKPPSSKETQSSLFFVGRNSRGNWVVQDARGFRGGLFLDRIQAIKFAKSEGGGRSPAVIVMKEPFELDMRSARGTA